MLYYKKRLLIKLTSIFGILILLALSSSKLFAQEKTDNSIDVKIHILVGPYNLNPVTLTSAIGNQIASILYQGLLVELTTPPYELKPALAINLPKRSLITVGETINGFTYKEGGEMFEYEIKEEAKWDNNTPITAHDYIFTIKAIKSPLTDCAHLKPYLAFIQDIVIDETNPKKFKIYCSGNYFQSLAWTGGYNILPEYAYDSQQHLRKYQLADFSNKDSLKKIKLDPTQINFAKEFNNSEEIIGSGPYKVSQFNIGEDVVCVKKNNWWADDNIEPQFANEVDKIIYTKISDWAIVPFALKSQNLDVVSSWPARIDESILAKSILKNYNYHTPDRIVYDYIGVNLKNPKLADIRVRQALAHLVDVDDIIKNAMNGNGSRTIGPIHPSKSYYNNSITPYEFNIAIAKKLLAEAGWMDSDLDGILDKEIEGVIVPLKLDFLTNQGNSRREKIGSHLKKNAALVGIEIEVKMVDWVSFIEYTRAHDFELYCGGWAGSTNLEDLKQIWHTESYNSGSNYVGFGNIETDKLIEEIRDSRYADNRDSNYLRIQEIIHQEIPYIFLAAQKNKILIHKSFTNTNVYTARPGFYPTEWKVNRKFLKKKLKAQR